MIKRFGISIPEDLLIKLDHLAKEKGYANRSETIRHLIRDRFVEEDWQKSTKEVIGTVSLVYDHHTRELSDKLTELQHSHYQNIISSMHIHLDHHNCLEVLVVKGKSKIIREIADKLIATKGVKHGKLVMTTTGQEL